MNFSVYVKYFIKKSTKKSRYFTICFLSVLSVLSVVNAFAFPSPQHLAPSPQHPPFLTPRHHRIHRRRIYDVFRAAATGQIVAGFVQSLHNRPYGFSAG